MKKSTIFSKAVVLLLCFQTIFIYGQQSCIYLHIQDDKTCYEISETKMFLWSKTMEESDIRRELDNLVSIIEMSDWPDKCFYIEIQNSSMDYMLELQREWNTKEGIVYASPVLIEGDLEFSYTNEIIVRLKSEEDYPILEKCAETYSAYDLKLVSEDELLYMFTLPDNNKKDAAEVSLEIIETGLFERARPNTITFFPFGLPSGNINTIPERTVVIYPNPVSDILHVDLEKEELYDIKLYNSHGSLCYQTKSMGGLMEINVSNLSNGIYFLNIYNGSSSKPETYKIIIKH